MKLAEEVQEEMRELERYLLEEKEPSWEDEQKDNVTRKPEETARKSS